MSAILQFGDNDAGIYSNQYPVVECDCQFSRHPDFYSPDSDPRCEKVMIMVVAPGKEDLELIEWYIDNAVLSGRILFDISDQAGGSGNDTTREIRFEDARCYFIEEMYEIASSKRRLLKMEFLAESVQIDSNLFERQY